LAIINAEEDVLDDKGVIEALKEAKADVFETLNDLTAEKKAMINMDAKVPPFKQVRLHFKVFLAGCGVKDRKHLVNCSIVRGYRPFGRKALG